MGPSRGGAPWRFASGRQRRLSLTACGNTVSPQIMQSAWMTAGRGAQRMGPLFPCHRCHGQDDEGHAEEFPETEGEAEDEEGEKNGGQRLDG